MNNGINKLHLLKTKGLLSVFNSETCILMYLFQIKYLFISRVVLFILLFISRGGQSVAARPFYAARGHLRKYKLL